MEVWLWSRTPLVGVSLLVAMVVTVRITRNAALVSVATEEGNESQCQKEEESHEGPCRSEGG